MKSEIRGFGRFLILVPVAVYLPLRFVVGEWEETHHAAIVCLVLAVSGALTLGIAAKLDRKAGIEVFSRHAWTKGIMESEHVFFFLPVRVVGALAILASLLIPIR